MKFTPQDRMEMILWGLSLVAVGAIIAMMLFAWW
jgi:hypothetical protein